MVNLDDEEVELVLETGVKIAHCPTTAGWFGYGLSQVSQFPEMIDRGATIGLGCDAETCSNNLDVVRAMYSSAIIFRDARRDMNVMPAEKVLEMATLHGARCALQEADLGSLEAGKKPTSCCSTRHGPSGGRSITRSPIWSSPPTATALRRWSSTADRLRQWPHDDDRRRSGHARDRSTGPEHAPAHRLATQNCLARHSISFHPLITGNRARRPSRWPASSASARMASSPFR